MRNLPRQSKLSLNKKTVARFGNGRMSQLGTVKMGTVKLGTVKMGTVKMGTVK